MNLKKSSHKDSNLNYKKLTHSKEKSVLQWKTIVYIQPSLLGYLILARSVAILQLGKLQVSITMKSYFYGHENSILVEIQLSSLPLLREEKPVLSHLHTHFKIRNL